jgi:hypothetical protein
MCKKLTTPLREHLLKSYDFSAVPTGDELGLDQIFKRVNHALEEFITPKELEACLVKIAEENGYVPNRCYIYPKPVFH